MITEFEQGAKRRMRILARLKELAVEPSEAAHIEADLLLCEYLEIIGAADLVAAYKPSQAPNKSLRFK